MDAVPLEALGERQRELLTLLLETKGGLSADELAVRLTISRTAVHQHLNLLERDRYVEKRPRAPQGGRPGYAWTLSEKGIHLFPKQYSLFSDLLIRSLKEKLGSEALADLLRGLGNELAKEHVAQLQGKPLHEQVGHVAEIMRELGYQASTVPDSDGPLPLIDARNCVYHHLAREHREVCELDLALLSTLLGAPIEHIECMVRGGAACRFRVIARAAKDKRAARGKPE